MAHAEAWGSPMAGGGARLERPTVRVAAHVCGVEALVHLPFLAHLADFFQALSRHFRDTPETRPLPSWRTSPTSSRSRCNPTGICRVVSGPYLYRP